MSTFEWLLDSGARPSREAGDYGGRKKCSPRISMATSHGKKIGWQGDVGSHDLEAAPRLPLSFLFGFFLLAQPCL